MRTQTDNSTAHLKQRISVMDSDLVSTERKVISEGLSRDQETLPVRDCNL